MHTQPLPAPRVSWLFVNESCLNTSKDKHWWNGLYLSTVRKRGLQMASHNFFYFSRISSVYQPYIRRMSAISNLTICQLIICCMNYGLLNLSTLIFWSISVHTKCTNGHQYSTYSWESARYSLLIILARRITLYCADCQLYLQFRI